MPHWRVWLGFALAALGCQTFMPAELDRTVPPAEMLWQLGQEAMRQGDPNEALVFYRRSLETDPSLKRNYLSIAAAYLEKGDEEAACRYLSKYVNAYPNQLFIRIHLADLFYQLDHLEEARTEFERCVAGAQKKGDAAVGQLIHCHAQLMVIAEDLEEAYPEHLHRGIGLLLLARRRAALPEPDGELSTEELLCKAAAELTLAHLEYPDEARPCWYLHEVWSCLAQQHSARRYLLAAEATAPFSHLTPPERCSLYVACHCRETQSPIK